MKLTVLAGTLSAAALLITTPSLQAQTVASTPVGFKKTTIAAEGVSLLSIDLLKPVVFQGAATVSGRTVTVVGEDLSAYKNGTYFLEFSASTTNPEMVGMNATIENDALSADTVTLAILDDLPLNMTGTVRIRQHWTVAELFGANNEIGFVGGASSAGADNIIVPESDGTVSVYWWKNAGVGTRDVWRQGSSSADAGGNIIYFTNAMLISRITGASELEIVLTGTVKEGVTVIPLPQGVSFLSHTLPVSVTSLRDSGLETQLQSGPSGAAADNLIVWDPSTGSVRVFFYKVGGVGTSNVWRESGSSADAGDTALPAGVLILRATQETAITLPGYTSN